MIAGEIATDELTENSKVQLPFSFAKRHGMFIGEETVDCITIVHRPRPSSQAIAEVQRYSQKPIKLKPVPLADFEIQLANAFETDSNKAMAMAEKMGEDLQLFQLTENQAEAEDLLDTEEDAPIIRLLNVLFSQAIKQQASDIHIETFENRIVIRLRIDGVLREVLEPQRKLAPLITSRIKVMAKLDIAEKRLPQDGRIALRIAGRAVDVRVSTMPTSFGERIVMRLLDKNTTMLDLQHLGLSPDALATMEQIIQRPHGIILVTGPTGSGKTTSLYATLSTLNQPGRNILTAEDPIEYYLPGIGQTQINPKIKMTFAKSLRAMLRQDPDVVMVGEIRDLETAQIAVQASLTGHLVLSTLHTNTAIGAVTRLRDMGIEPFLLASSLVGVIAQRLIRTLCEHCKQTKTATVSECEILDLDPRENIPIYEAEGCDECGYTGFNGRTGIYEIIPIDAHLSMMIHDDHKEQDMIAYTRAHHHSIRQDGCRHVIAGRTTIEEVLRVTHQG